MSEEPRETPPLQFETAEGLQGGSRTCDVCGAALPGEYHELNGHPVCAVCRGKAEAEHARDSQWNQFVVAAVYGCGAAALGGLLYWGFVKITNIELGLMAIAVGWLVGKAVMRGSNLRGGRRYQWLAVALTYFSITLSYGALMIEAAMNQPKADPKAEVAKSAKRPPVQTDTGQQEPMTAGKAALGIGFLLLIILASPFLAGFSNILGWVIIAIGLWEAWKQTAQIPFITGGPYQFGNSPPAPDVAG